MLQRVLDRLEGRYGRPKRPVTTDPFEMVLYENVAYLVPDAQREQVFAALREGIGTQPGCISAASGEELLAVTRLGRGFASQCAEKLRRADHIALKTFQGNLKKVLRLPFAEARRSLQKFPGIGEPGAKILLFSGAYPVLALDSNALRVLMRLGFGEERKTYSAKYRAAQEAVRDQIIANCGWLTRAYRLLRRHGQAVCKANRPQCHDCALADVCRFYQSQKH